MTSVINLDDFLSEMTILHCDTAQNYTEGLNVFVENPKKVDIVTYNHTKHFSLLNFTVLKIDSQGHYYYDYVVEINGDMIDNICFKTSSNLKVKLTYYVGNVIYNPEDIDKFLIISSWYHEFKIRITFLERPNINDTFKILSRYYLIDIPYRRKLAKSSVFTKNGVYENGMFH